jgi:hypothetical protein
MTQNLTGPPFLPHGFTARGKPRHDVGKDEKRHALADTALGDELGQPHDKGRARGQDEHHEETEPQGEPGNQVDVESEQGLVVPVEGVDQTGRLQQGESNGQVPRRLSDLLLAHGPLVPPLGEFGNNRGEKLDHDGARDVGHDAQAEDGETRQRTAGEEV